MKCSFTFKLMDRDIKLGIEPLYTTIVEGVDIVAATREDQEL